MKKIILLLIASVFLASCSGGKKITDTVTHYTLDNGLQLFVAENHAVPLTYIEIAVRCGALTQTVENAGIFHLYEHMMFKGNSLYPDAASVQNALSQMGCASWNGSTDIQCVNYFFTIPSYETEKGLAFWNAAIREPLMDEEEFEREKSVVISEINGNINNPGFKAAYLINKEFFKSAPWKADPSGIEKTVRNADLSLLKEIKERYYVPDNAALFVGGDVEPEKVFEMVNRIYGSWKKGKGNYDEQVPSFSKEPFGKPELYVMPLDRISDQIGQVEILYRGADSDLEPEDTYALDVLSNYFSDPDSSFVKEILSHEELCIPDNSYVGFGYGTHRRMGRIDFTGVMMNPSERLYERAEKFLDVINKELLPEYLSSDEIVPKENRKLLKQQLKDERIYNEETAEGILSTLRFWWCDAGIDYYMNYPEKINAVKNADLKNVLKKYIEGKNPLVIVFVNPEIYAAQKAEYDKAGFTEITSENCFWWRKENE